MFRNLSFCEFTSERHQRSQTARSIASRPFSATRSKADIARSASNVRLVLGADVAAVIFLLTRGLAIQRA